MHLVLAGDLVPAGTTLVTLALVRSVVKLWLKFQKAFKGFVVTAAL